MRLTFPKLAGVLSPLPLALACASHGPMNVITEPQLARSRTETAYDAVRHIRPEMLRSRSPGSLQLFRSSNPAVALDNVVIGGVAQLRSIATADVARIEYVNALMAAKKYGLTSPDGVVLVTSRNVSGTELSVTDAKAAAPGR